MPDRDTFRQAVMLLRPDLKGLRCNKIKRGEGSGYYTVTVPGVMTFHWIDEDEPVLTAVRTFLAELNDCMTHAPHS